MIDPSTIRYRISKIKHLCRSRIEVYEVDPQDNYYVVTIYGGDNGYGRLTNYLSDIKLIVDQFEDVWLIDWVNDVLDDVWTLRIGIQNTKPCDLKELL